MVVGINLLCKFTTSNKLFSKLKNSTFCDIINNMAIKPSKACNGLKGKLYDNASKESSQEDDRAGVD